MDNSEDFSNEFWLDDVLEPEVENVNSELLEQASPYNEWGYKINGMKDPDFDKLPEHQPDGNNNPLLSDSCCCGKLLGSDFFCEKHYNAEMWMPYEGFQESYSPGSASYFPESDHCYAVKPVMTEENVPNTAPAVVEPPQDIFIEDEIDVVTIDEEKEPQPVRILRLRRNTQSKKAQKQTTVPTKSLKTNRKNNAVPNKRGRKVNSPQFSPTSLSATNSASGSDSEERTKKDFHNQCERMRRKNQQCNFQDLRLAIPELRKNMKASKLLILKKAAALAKRKEELFYERQINTELRAKLEKVMGSATWSN